MKLINRTRLLKCIAACLISHTGVGTTSAAFAEGKDPVVDSSSTTKKLESLGRVEMAMRPLVTVYEVTSNVSEIEARAATAMFTTALVKSRQFRVLERNKIPGGVAKERFPGDGAAAENGTFANKTPNNNG